jgi:hypothetical protein
LEILDGAVSADGALRVTLVSFDAPSGEGRVRIEELSQEKARFYVTLKHGDGCETRIEYETYDVHKAAEHSFFTHCNDVLKNIEIVRLAIPESPE